MSYLHLKYLQYLNTVYWHHDEWHGTIMDILVNNKIKWFPHKEQTTEKGHKPQQVSYQVSYARRAIGHTANSTRLHCCDICIT